jgi:hypothetical protein
MINAATFEGPDHDISALVVGLDGTRELKRVVVPVVSVRTVVAHLPFFLASKVSRRSGMDHSRFVMRIALLGRECELLHLFSFRVRRDSACVLDFANGLAIDLLSCLVRIRPGSDESRLVSRVLRLRRMHNAGSAGARLRARAVLVLLAGRACFLPFLFSFSFIPMALMGRRGSALLPLADALATILLAMSATLLRSLRSFTVLLLLLIPAHHPQILLLLLHLLITLLLLPPILPLLPSTIKRHSKRIITRSPPLLLDPPVQGDLFDRSGRFGAGEGRVTGAGDGFDGAGLVEPRGRGGGKGL